MIRGASLLKDGAGGASELDELRAELVKQKIIFEAEMRRQREVSDERFDAAARQLAAALEDNTQLRRTMHALGDRVALLEQHQAQLARAQRSRSSSPVPAPGNSGAVTPGGAAQRRPVVGGGAYSRQASSPVPHATVSPVSAAALGGGRAAPAATMVRLRPTPSTTPLTTPRAAITRTASAVSMGGAPAPAGGKSADAGAVGATSPAHVQFRPVLRNPMAQPFRSPLRQSEVVAQIGRNVAAGRWR
jgi:hypothetical protein